MICSNGAMPRGAGWRDRFWETTKLSCGRAPFGTSRHFDRIDPRAAAVFGLIRSRLAIGRNRARLGLTINGEIHHLDIEPETPMLWALRDEIGLTGTKFGCGIAQCGACTVPFDGQPVRSCSLSVADANGTAITTIEGLSPDASHPV